MIDREWNTVVTKENNSNVALRKMFAVSVSSCVHILLELWNCNNYNPIPSEVKLDSNDDRWNCKSFCYFFLNVV